MKRLKHYDIYETIQTILYKIKKRFLSTVYKNDVLVLSYLHLQEFLD